MTRTTSRALAVAIALVAAPAASILPGPGGGLSAQTVRGAVHAAGDGRPVSDVRLILRSADGEVVAAAISTEDGRFQLRAAAGGLVRLEVAHIGYADWQTANFALASGATIDVEVKLGVEAIPLDPIVVVAQNRYDEGRLAGFEQRRTDPGGFGGYFMTQDDIERRPMATPSSLVLGAPGMGLQSAGSNGDRAVIMTGRCPARLFVDGIRVEQSAQHSIDDLLPPDQIAGVEMYPRALSAPVQYQDAGRPDCGVVLFWTREPRPGAPGRWGFRRMAVGLGLVAGILTFGFTR